MMVLRVSVLIIERLSRVTDVYSVALCPRDYDSGKDSWNLCDMDKVSKLELSGLNEASLTVYVSMSSLDLGIHRTSVIMHIRVERYSKKGVKALEPIRLLDMLVMAGVKR